MATPAAATPPPAPVAWPEETDILILPDGRVVVTDLPAPLAAALAALGRVEPCEVGPFQPAEPAPTVACGEEAHG
jgi:hypothetical protein